MSVRAAFTSESIGVDAPSRGALGLRAGVLVCVCVCGVGRAFVAVDGVPGGTVHCIGTMMGIGPCPALG